MLLREVESVLAIFLFCTACLRGDRMISYSSQWNMADRTREQERARKNVKTTARSAAANIIYCAEEENTILTIPQLNKILYTNRKDKSTGHRSERQNGQKS